MGFGNEDGVPRPDLGGKRNCVLHPPAAPTEVPGDIPPTNEPSLFLKRKKHN